MEYQIKNRDDNEYDDEDDDYSNEDDENSDDEEEIVEAPKVKQEV